MGIEKQPYPITELYAWVVDDETKVHGVMGVMTRDHIPMQAVSSRRDLMEHIELQIQIKLIAASIGKPVKLQRFVLAETIKEFP